MLFIFTACATNVFDATSYELKSNSNLMKKILSLVALLIVIGQVHANPAAPKSPVGMSVVKSGEVVKLFYRGEKTGNVKVTIYNERGEEVYAETLRKTEHFMRPYNISALPDGNYTIELRDEQGTRTQNVTHNRAEKKRVAHLTRLISIGKNKYMLAVPNDGRDALTVKIFNEKEELLYENTEVIVGDFARLYNLNKVKGNHTFEIIDKSGNVNRLSKPLQR